MPRAGEKQPGKIRRVFTAYSPHKSSRKGRTEYGNIPTSNKLTSDSDFLEADPTFSQRRRCREPRHSGLFRCAIIRREGRRTNWDYRPRGPAEEKQGNNTRRIEAQSRSATPASPSIRGTIEYSPRPRCDVRLCGKRIWRCRRQGKVATNNSFLSRMVPFFFVFSASSATYSLLSISSCNCHRELNRTEEKRVWVQQYHAITST